MHEHDAYVQRPQYSNVEQNICEVFIRNDGTVDAQNECFLSELRYVLENPAQVGKFHVLSSRLNAARQFVMMRARPRVKRTIIPKPHVDRMTRGFVRTPTTYVSYRRSD